jgi:hypothetical protein
MARRTDPGQFELFADQPAQVAPVKVDHGTPSGYGGQPDVLVRVLDEIHDGRYGQIDPSGRVVVLDGDGHCRHPDDELTTIVEHLVAQRFAGQGEFTTQLHGAIRKNIYLVKLTNAGHRIRTRWSHLAGTR